MPPALFFRGQSFKGSSNLVYFLSYEETGHVHQILGQFEQSEIPFNVFSMSGFNLIDHSVSCSLNPNFGIPSVYAISLNDRCLLSALHISLSCCRLALFSIPLTPLILSLKALSSCLTQRFPFPFYILQERQLILQCPTYKAKHTQLFKKKILITSLKKI